MEPRRDIQASRTMDQRASLLVIGNPTAISTLAVWLAFPSFNVNGWLAAS